MKIAIILGYCLNDDGTPRDKMIERLNITLNMISELHPDKIICSGGIANKAAGISEASVMSKWLIEHGVDKDMLILEDKSGSTHGNALYSMPIALEYNPDEIIIVSSMDHFINRPYNTMEYFNNMLEGRNINFVVYTRSKTIE